MASHERTDWNPQAILTVAETRAAENAVIAAGTSAETLMEHAGRHAAAAIMAFGGPREVLVLCGPGNNGGDGYVVARVLREAGCTVTVAASAPTATPAAAGAAARWAGPVSSLADAGSPPAVVDALFGSGLTRPLGPELRHAAAPLMAAARVRVALDLPSGIDADSGADLGAMAAADLTVAFGALKPAHCLEPGRSWCGRIVLADIGLGEIAAQLHHVAPLRLAPLQTEAHKYARGAVLVLGGPAGQGGAARLTARAALRSGAGLAMIAVSPDALAENAARLDAVMLRPVRNGAALRELLASRRFAAVAAGPGLGTGAAAGELLAALLASGLPAVLDADVFTLFANAPERLGAALGGPAVLTPHAGEFVRLFGALPGSKVDQARAAAVRVGAVVLLKGADTVVAAPDGRAAINTHASPYLATAGSGDVLTGIVTGLLAQGQPPFEAACAAAWLHGDAGLRGGAGLTADDIPELLPAALRELLMRA